ncbi:MAG: DMT family transporter [Limnohabitans sp.]|nr:DMT family transporter [Limnohabitans sp.]
MLALIALTLMWGINWPMMKVAVRELPPLYMRGLTMFLGASWLMVYFRYRGLRLWPDSPREWRDIVLLGIPNIFILHTVSILGIVSLSSGCAAILSYVFPVWTVVFGVVFMGQQLNKRVVIAVIVALLGIGLLISHELTALQGKPIGVMWMEIGAISWTIGTLWMRRIRFTLPVQSLSVWMLMLSSPFIILLAMATETWPTWDISPMAWGALFYTVFVNYGFAQLIWFGFARDLPSSTSAMSIMAVPLIGTLFATFMVGEWPHWQDDVALICVLTAIAAVLLPSRAPSPAND